MDSLYIVMPAYNEEANIENTVKQWYPLLVGKGNDSRLVIADSGSNDNTHAILLFMQQNGYDKLEILSETGKYHGPKVIALYEYAIRNGADYVFQTDSDGQTNPNEFDKFWQMRKQFNGIFGNRVIRGDGSDRAFVEHVVCFLVKMFFGVKLPDANAPFRLMNVKTVEKYLPKLPKEYNLPNIMLTTYFAYFHEPMSFCEISFKPRQGGVNSINIKKIVQIGWHALGDFWMLRRNIE